MGIGAAIPLGGGPVRGGEMSDQGHPLAGRGLEIKPTKAGPDVMLQNEKLVVGGRGDERPGSTAEQGCGNLCTWWR